jgi:hypothetical protein
LGGPGGALRVVVETHGLPFLSPGHLGHKIWENQSYGHSTILDGIPQVYKGHTYIYIEIDRLVFFIYVFTDLFDYLFIIHISLSLSLQRHPDGSICSFIYLFI